jgi:NAD(P)-dependent dehydrogenase (short-subunit alcohol dehydrogenase family)
VVTVNEALDRMFSVEGKVAVVTGGTRGIGRMIAEGLVAVGARVYVTSRKADACDETVASLSQQGECFGFAADLGTLAGVEALACHLAEREPKVHILVNNAGALWEAPLEEYPDSAFDKLWALNVKGVFHLTRLLLPQLRAAATHDDPARVVNIGSNDGIKVPSFETYAYSASKAGVHMLTRHLAHRLASEHITVNAIAPGVFPSKMIASVLNDPEKRAALMSEVPLGRPGTPAQAAGTVIYFCSEAGAFVTGAVLPVDGGMSTHGGGPASAPLG